MKRWTAVFISGVSWLFVGIFLLMKGMKLIVQVIESNTSDGLCNYLTQWTSGLEQSGSFLIAIGVFFGFFNSRLFLRRTALKLVSRISQLSEPISFKEMIEKKTLFTVAFMIFIGFILRILPIGVDIYGTVLVMVGSSLVSGAFAFFRYSSYVKSLKN